MSPQHSTDMEGKTNLGGTAHQDTQVPVEEERIGKKSEVLTAPMSESSHSSEAATGGEKC